MGNGHMTRVSASDPDMARERAQRLWDPSRRLLRSIRAYQAAGSGPAGWVRRKVAALAHRFWSVVTQAEIDLNARIDGGLLIPHPNGIIIHPDVKIGPNCLIFQQVTLGMGRGGVPRLGGHVDIGAGAKVLGPVSVGDNAVIGANAVVLCDVPSGTMAVGVPARIVQQRKGET
jgi:serine O-acetyltransferase